MEGEVAPGEETTQRETNCNAELQLEAAYLADLGRVPRIWCTPSDTGLSLAATAHQILRRRFWLNSLDPVEVKKKNSEALGSVALSSVLEKHGIAINRASGRASPVSF